MKRLTIMSVAAVLIAGSAAAAEVINTYVGPITVTPGTVAYGEVGTLLNADQMNGVGFNTQYWNPPGNPGVQAAGSTLDHYWVQSSTNVIIWGLSMPVSAVLGFPGTDHGPLPQENLEYRMWGSDDLDNWYVGELTAIYHDGWDPSPPAGATDDWYATRWDFSESYRYFKTVGAAGVVVGWSDFDPEMDGIAAAVCPNIPAPGAILLGTVGIGLVNWLRRRKTL